VTCDELRAIAADVALDDVTGAERAAALTHLAECERCRALVASLAGAADSLLLLAPTVEPPPGFESRVLARIESARPPIVRGRVRARGPIVLAAAAALVAAVAGGVVGTVTANGGGRGLPRAMELRTARGAVAGNVLLASGPDRMTCVFEAEGWDGGYEVELLLDDGSVAEVGDFQLEVTPWSWTVPLDVRAESVREVGVRDDDGTVRATARLD
jgi:hypothetical protein